MTNIQIAAPARSLPVERREVAVTSWRTRLRTTLQQRFGRPHLVDGAAHDVRLQAARAQADALRFVR